MDTTQAPRALATRLLKCVTLRLRNYMHIGTAELAVDSEVKGRWGTGGGMGTERKDCQFCIEVLCIANTIIARLAAANAYDG